MTEHQRLRAAAETMMESAHVLSLVMIESGRERTLMTLVDETRTKLRAEAHELFALASRLEARAIVAAEREGVPSA